MSATTETSECGVVLGDLIQEALASTREADPHVIAGQLVTTLPPAVRDHLVLAGLVYRVRQVIHRQRGSALSGQKRSAGPSKWEISLPIRVTVGDTPKLIDDCCLADLETLAEDYRKRGREMFSRASEADALADALRASGCRTVGEMWARDGEALAA